MSSRALAAPHRVAVVTGASRGIGAAIARLLAERGMGVAVNFHRSESAAKQVVADIDAAGGQAIAVGADVCDPDAVQQMIDTVAARWGRVDVLVHNALIPYAIKSFGEISWAELGGKVDRELHAAFGLTKAVLPGMIERRYGRIVFLGTGLARHPRADMIALGTAKAALTQFARFVAQETAPHGVTVNVVAPGPVDDTGLADVFGAEHKEHMAAAAPMGRMAEPEDVARVVAFYAGDDAAFITGATAAVDGGVTMD